MFMAVSLISGQVLRCVEKENVLFGWVKSILIYVRNHFLKFLSGPLAEIPEEEEAFNQFSYIAEKGNNIQS